MTLLPLIVSAAPLTLVGVISKIPKQQLQSSLLKHKLLEPAEGANNDFQRQ